MHLGILSETDDGDVEGVHVGGDEGVHQGAADEHLDAVLSVNDTSAVGEPPKAGRDGGKERGGDVLGGSRHWCNLTRWPRDFPRVLWTQRAPNSANYQRSAFLGGRPVRTLVPASRCASAAPSIFSDFKPDQGREQPS